MIQRRCNPQQVIGSPLSAKPVNMQNKQTNEHDLSHNPLGECNDNSIGCANLSSVSSTQLLLSVHGTPPGDHCLAPLSQAPL